MQGARSFRVILRQNASRVIKMKAAYKMYFIRHREGFGHMQQMFGCLVNMHVVAKLAQQHDQSGAMLHNRARVMRQQVQAVGRAGEQEAAQRVVARFRIETNALKILLKYAQVMLRQTA